MARTVYAALWRRDLEGRQPIAVTHQATTLDQAVTGAAGKLKSSVERTLDRDTTLKGLRDHR